ncbi:MAG: FtsK/SpoIIIE domain-containing protein [Acidimicrobiales bacterium]
MVRLEPEHTVAELGRALGPWFWPGAAGEATLARAATGEILDPARSMAEIGLLSGEAVRIGKLRRHPSTGLSDRPVAGGYRAASHPSDAPAAGADRPALELIVRSGPDVGRRWVLDPSVTPLLGRDRGCALVFDDPTVGRRHARLSVDGTGCVLRPGPEAPTPPTVDGVPIAGPHTLGAGELVRLGATTFTVGPRLVPSPSGPGSSGVGGPAPGGPGELGTVAFHRTPYYPTPVEQRRFDPLDEIPDRPEPIRFAYLAALAPLVVGVVLALVYSPRFLLFAALSPVVAIAGHVEQRRRARSRYGRGEERYRRLLARRRHEIADALGQERHRRRCSAPDLAELIDRARRRSVELWVRDRSAPDFLTLRLGLGDIPAAVTVTRERRGDERLRDELEAELAELDVLRDVPVTLDLGRHPVVALVGRAADVGPLAASLVCQAACLHSPEDLVIASIGAGGAGPERWLRWLPHTRAASAPVGGDLVTGRSDGDTLLRALLAAAAERVDRPDRTIDRRWPRLLLVVDRAAEPDPVLLSRLLDVGPAAGFVFLWLTDDAGRVPRQAVAVVTCASLVGGGRSLLAPTDPDLAPIALEIDRASPAAVDDAARCLAAVRDASSVTGSTMVARLVTLDETFGRAVTPDWIEQRWRRSRSHHLPAPVGRTADAPLVLDLVEHGPHGLIGGTSGSGKSELLSALVAGLVACNPPRAVNVLFIDYKGGAASDPFVGLPHTVGVVTNLDALLARRALTSLRAELDRRMDLLQGRARDLAEMIERYPDEAPPALVIVVDEFATLVKEIPDFVTGVVDIAQRGRSLGIHLLLATQRPSGAVNDNILANTNLRISLRMLDGAESSAVIGTADAAAIPNPLKGRGLARLGPGELVTFQTAWTAAPVAADGGPAPIAVSALVPGSTGPPATVRPSPVTDPAPAPAERPEPARDRQPVGGTGTQLDALLGAVRIAARATGETRARSPWLDELPAHLPLDVVAHHPHGGITLGLVDDPAAQAQHPAVVDLDGGGGLLVFGTGGAGKTTALVTLAVSAALHDAEHGAGDLTVVGLDFASRRLAVLDALPACRIVAGGDDLEAVTRVIASLDEELGRRRAAVAERAGDGDPLRFSPVLVLIDDYGNLAQTFEGAGAGAVLYSWLETLNRIVVDGRGVGIHPAITATRRAVVKPGVLAAISNRIVLRQADPAGYVELGLPGTLAAADLAPGRGFTERGLAVQVATVVPSSGPTSPGDERQALTSLFPPPCVGAAGSPPVGDEIVGSALPAHLEEAAGPRPPLSISLGVADLDHHEVVVDLALHDLVVVGDPRSGRSTALATVAGQALRAGCELWVVGSSASPLRRLPATPAGSPAGAATATAAFGRAADVVPALERLAELEHPVDHPPGARHRRVLIVDDIDLLDDPVLDPVCGRLLAAGVRYVVSSAAVKGYSTNPLIQNMRKARAVLHLRPPGAREVQELTGCLPRLRPGLTLVAGRGVLVVDRQPVVVQVAEGGAGAGATTAGPLTRCRAPGRRGSAPACG